MLASKEVSKRNVISAAKIYFARGITRFFTGEWGRGEGAGLRTLWEHHYMIIIRMMLCNRTSVPLVLLISDYRREMTRFNRAPKKKIQSNLKFSSKW